MLTIGSLIRLGPILKVVAEEINSLSSVHVFIRIVSRRQTLLQKWNEFYKIKEEQLLTE